MHSDITADDFISQLVNDGLSSVPWLDSTFTKDFILLAEFSEMEGPKHILTIPKDVKSKFNLETFAVRIMSVDCVSILQTTDMATFNIAGDIQVVLTEVSEGAVAFVHHFVLYDIRARGYVRPYCLAYVTRNHTGLMKIFEDLLQFFSLVSSLFHFGNAMSFINDLVIRWEHLCHLKAVLAEKQPNIYVDENILSESQIACLMKTDIDENISQMKVLHKIFQDYLDKDIYAEHRELFNARYKQTCMKNMEPRSRDKSKCHTCEQEAMIRFPDYSHIIRAENTSSTCHEVPADVIASILGKKYDKPLRQLNELCDVTYNGGLDILKFTLKTYSGGNVAVAKGVQFQLPHSIEQAIERNFQSMEQDPWCTAPEDCCSKPSRKPMSLKQFVSRSCGQQGITVKLNANNSGTVVTNRKASAFDIDNSFLSSMTVTSLEKPFIRNNSINSHVGSVSNSSNGHFVNSPSGSPNSSSGSFKENITTSSEMSRQTSTTDSFADFDKISLTSSLVSSIIRENGVSDVDVSKYSFVSLLGMRHKYSFLSHAVYSLLIGRVLVVIGEEKNRNKVRHIVFGLANFLPNKGNCKSVIPWLNGPFSLNHIGYTGIVGMLKNPKGKTIANSLRPYVSILDFEEETLFAPRYSGKFLSDMFNTNTCFTADVSYRQFILQLFAELYSKVFIRFIKLCEQPDKFSSNYGLTVSDGARSMQKRELKDDEAIMVCFIQRMREELLQSFNGSQRDDATIRTSRLTMKVNHMKSSVFCNFPKRKKYEVK